MLYCYDCKNLKELPPLPPTLQELFCYGCPNLKELPVLPQTLLLLACHNCPKLYLPYDLHKEHRSEEVFVPSLECCNKLSHIYTEFSIMREVIKEVYMIKYNYNSEWVRENLYTKYEITV